MMIWEERLQIERMMELIRGSNIDGEGVSFREKEVPSGGDVSGETDVTRDLDQETLFSEILEEQVMEPCQHGNDNLISSNMHRKTESCGEDDLDEQVARAGSGVGGGGGWKYLFISTDSLFCIPCLLFSDTLSRGETWRTNQGKDFVSEGFSNWDKPIERIKKHERTVSHLDAKKCSSSLSWWFKH